MTRSTETRLLEDVLELVNQLLKVQREIPEDLRIKLAQWRQWAEMIVNGQSSDD